MLCDDNSPEFRPPSPNGFRTRHSENIDGNDCKFGIDGKRGLSDTHTRIGVARHVVRLTVYMQLK